MYLEFGNFRNKATVSKMPPLFPAEQRSSCGVSTLEVCT